jgi:hypothetical protein
VDVAAGQVFAGVTQHGLDDGAVEDRLTCGANIVTAEFGAKIPICTFSKYFHKICMYTDIF